LDDFSLKGKRILVTGATSGIGSEIVRVLVRYGAKIYAIGRNHSKLAALTEGTEQIECISGDLTDPTFTLDLVKGIDRVDGLVYSAGLMGLKPLNVLKNKDVDGFMSINFEAAFSLSKELINQKKLIKEGSMVFISSVYGVMIGGRGNLAYSASKGALNGMIKSMALDLAHLKIRVNQIAPGMIETSGLDQTVTGSISVEAMNEEMKRYPLGKFGSPHDVAFASLYLLSDVSKWVTGSTLVVDGGLTIH
jgi:NAD(P)-dependent dehydrogenase (short-subunit alcohol dehydrogenase family)